MHQVRQRGSQIIEFALVLPLLLLLILMAVDLAVLHFDQTLITTVTRDAARKGAMLSAADWHPAELSEGACNTIRRGLISFDRNSSSQACSATVSPEVLDPASAFGTEVVVSISCPVTGLFWTAAAMLLKKEPAHSSAFLLQSSTSMLHE